MVEAVKWAEEIVYVLQVQVEIYSVFYSRRFDRSSVIDRLRCHFQQGASFKSNTLRYNCILRNPIELITVHLILITMAMMHNRWMGRARAS